MGTCCSKLKIPNCVSNCVPNWRLPNCLYKSKRETKLSSSGSVSIILKIPHSKNCFQVDNDSHCNNWKFNKNINTVLKNLYDKNTKFKQWIVYNDESPDATHSNGGHAKGILAWNNEEITWLIHSVPKFPKKFNGTKHLSKSIIEDSELLYGQSFVFIKINISHLDNILKQLFVMQPHIYISNFEHKIYKDIHNTCFENIYEINNTLFHVAKSPSCDKDLYENILIHRFGGVCHTETWVRGHHCEDNDKCKMISKIDWGNGESYDYKRDHSKYCFSDNGWVMVGDLNRMTTQFKRGGGGLVIHNKKINALFGNFAIQ